MALPLPSVLILLLLSFGHLAWTQRPEPWTVTSYFESYTRTYTGYTGSTYTESDSETTRLVPVTPTVDNPRAITTTTSSNTYFEGVVYHNVVLEPSQGPINTEFYPYSSSTTYVYNVVFDLTFPTGCTYTDSTSYVPASTQVTQTLGLVDNIDLSGVVSPIESTTMARRRRIWRLDPTDIPGPIFDNARKMASPHLYDRCEQSYYHFDGNYSECTEWRWRPLGDTIGGGYRCSNGIFHTWGLQLWSLLLTILLAWFFFFLCLGLWENFRRFKQLMTGHESRRGIPMAWGCLFPVLALFLCFFRRDGFASLSRHEKEGLTKQWDAMPVGKKLKLWLRYGFTYGYPPMLGTPPPPRTQLYRPAAPRTAAGEAGSGVELVPPPYTRVPTPRTSMDAPTGQRPDPTLPQPPSYAREVPQELPQEPPSYARREELP